MAGELDDLKKEFSSSWGPVAASEQPATPLDDLKRQYKSSWKEGVRAVTPREPTPDPVEAANPKDFEGGTLELGFPPFTGTIDTRIPIGGKTKMRQAQLGSGISDTIQGVRQLLGKETAQDVDVKRETDRPLKTDLEGKAINLLGKTLPAFATPGGFIRGAGGPLFENAAIGAAQGAVEPVGTGESRAMNIGAGALGGGALSVLPAAMRRNLAGMDPETRALAEEAQRRGMPLSYADVTPSGWVRDLRSIMDDSILPGMSSAGQRDAKQEAFHRMTGSAWGVPRSTHTPTQLQGDKATIGGDIENMWAQHDIPLFGGFNGLEANLARRRADAAEFGTAPGTVGNTVDVNIRRGLEDQLISPTGTGDVLPGRNAFATQKNWRKKYEGGTDEVSDAMMGARQDVIDAYRQQLNPVERAAFDERRSQFRAASALNKVMAKNSVGRAGREIGDIRPTDLSSAVEQSYGGTALDSPFGNVPRIGEKFLTDRTIRTGGSNRALLQNAGVIGAASGAGLLGGTASLPFLAGSYGLGLGASHLMNSPSFLRFLQNGGYRAGRPALDRLVAGAGPRAASRGALSAVNAYPVEVRGTRDSKDEE